MSLIATGRYTPRDELGRFVTTKLVPGFMQAIEAATKTVVEYAKGYVPVDTGELQRSIGSRIDQKGNSVYGSVYADMPYAAYVEFGTGERGAAANVDVGGQVYGP